MAEFQIQDADFAGLKGKVVIVTGKKKMPPLLPILLLSLRPTLS